MELRQYFALIRKWFWLIVVCTALAAVAAFVASRWQTPIYEASSTVLIAQASAGASQSYNDILTSERLARTYAQMLQDWPVLERTIQEQGFLNPFKDVKKAFQIELNIASVRDTQLMKLTVEANDPQLAADLANRLPQVFARFNQQRQQERYTQLRQELQAEIAATEQDTAAAQQVLQRLGDGETDRAERVRLQSLLDRYQATYSSLLRSTEELRLSEVESTDNILLTAPALTPQNPVRPRVLFNTLLAAIVGAMLAVGAAFLIEYLDDTIKTPDDILAWTGLPTLGAVVMAEDVTATHYPTTLTNPRSPAAEAYRGLRTNLQFSSVDKPLHTLLVTSAVPNEGKSTTAVNLAVVAAQMGQRVVLVDADLRRARLHRTFQLPNSVGVTTALLQQGDGWRDDLRTTSLPGLQLLSSGPIPPNPAELLGSARMGDLLAQLAQAADLVIIDSPPLLAVSDALLLAQQVDGILLVASAGETRLGMLVQAVQRLETVGLRPLGVVLNKLTQRTSSYYYTYYYDYAHRYEDSSDTVVAKQTGYRLRWPKSFKL